MKQLKDELSEFFDLAKSELIRANQDRRHPFRNMTLATHDEFPSVRTVVKRKTLEDLSTLIYTDERSKKVKQINMNEKCSLLLYHGKKKLQIIILGQCSIVTDGPLFDEHQSIALRNRKDYSTEKAPGEKIDSSTYQYGDDAYFTLLKIVPESIEVLHLGKPFHKRAKFVTKEEDWVGTWLVP